MKELGDKMYNILFFEKKSTYYSCYSNKQTLTALSTYNTKDFKLVRKKYDKTETVVECDLCNK